MCVCVVACVCVCVSVFHLLGVGCDTDGGWGSRGAPRETLVQLLRQERHEGRNEEESRVQTCVARDGSRLVLHVHVGLCVVCVCVYVCVCDVCVCMCGWGRVLL